MDGRVQLPVIQYLQRHFNAEYVDTITEPGPNRILADEKADSSVRQNILDRTIISIERHASVGIAIIGHYDCAGNPVSDATQIAQIKQATQVLRQQFEDMTIIGLWVDENWNVHNITASENVGNTVE